MRKYSSLWFIWNSSLALSGIIVHNKLMNLMKLIKLTGINMGTVKSSNDLKINH